MWWRQSSPENTMSAPEASASHKGPAEAAGLAPTSASAAASSSSSAAGRLSEEHCAPVWDPSATQPSGPSSRPRGAAAGETERDSVEVQSERECCEGREESPGGATTAALGRNLQAANAHPERREERRELGWGDERHRRSSSERLALFSHPVEDRAGGSACAWSTRARGSQYYNEAMNEIFEARDEERERLRRLSRRRKVSKEELLREEDADALHSRLDEGGRSRRRRADEEAESDGGSREGESFRADAAKSSEGRAGRPRRFSEDRENSDASAVSSQFAPSDEDGRRRRKSHRDANEKASFVQWETEVEDACPADEDLTEDRKTHGWTRKGLPSRRSKSHWLSLRRENASQQMKKDGSESRERQAESESGGRRRRMNSEDDQAASNPAACQRSSKEEGSGGLAVASETRKTREDACEASPSLRAARARADLTLEDASARMQDELFGDAPSSPRASMRRHRDRQLGKRETRFSWTNPARFLSFRRPRLQASPRETATPSPSASDGEAASVRRGGFSGQREKAKGLESFLSFQRDRADRRAQAEDPRGGTWRNRRPSDDGKRRRDARRREGEALGEGEERKPEPRPFLAVLTAAQTDETPAVAEASSSRSSAGIRASPTDARPSCNSPSLPSMSSATFSSQVREADEANEASERKPLTRTSTAKGRFFDLSVCSAPSPPPRKAPSSDRGCLSALRELLPSLLRLRWRKVDGEDISAVCSTLLPEADVEAVPSRPPSLEVDRVRPALRSHVLIQIQRGSHKILELQVAEVLRQIHHQCAENERMQRELLRREKARRRDARRRRRAEERAARRALEQAQQTADPAEDEGDALGARKETGGSPHAGPPDARRRGASWSSLSSESDTSEDASSDDASGDWTPWSRSDTRRLSFEASDFSSASRPSRPRRRRQVYTASDAERHRREEARGGNRGGEAKRGGGGPWNCPWGQETQRHEETRKRRFRGCCGGTHVHPSDICSRHFHCCCGSFSNARRDSWGGAREDKGRRSRGASCCSSSHRSSPAVSTIGRLTYRDCRQAFTDGYPIPSIEVRRHVILVCLPPVTCFVLWNCVYVVMSDELEPDRLISQLSRLSRFYATLMEAEHSRTKGRHRGAKRAERPAGNWPTEGSGNDREERDREEREREEREREEREREERERDDASVCSRSPLSPDLPAKTSVNGSRARAVGDASQRRAREGRTGERQRGQDGKIFSDGSDDMAEAIHVQLPGTQTTSFLEVKKAHQKAPSPRWHRAESGACAVEPIAPEAGGEGPTEGGESSETAVSGSGGGSPSASSSRRAKGDARPRRDGDRWSAKQSDLRRRKSDGEESHEESNGQDGSATPHPLPFEFAALECIFFAAFQQLNSDILYLERKFADTRQKTSKNTEISSILMEGLHSLKEPVAFYQDRVHAFDKAFDELLLNSADLHRMELTKLHRNPDLYGDDPNRDQVNPDLEILLEYFDQEMDQFKVRVRHLKEGIENTERLISLRLSLMRNRLIRWELAAAVVAAGLAIGTCISGLFGMNLENGYEDGKTSSHDVFLAVSGVVTTVALLSILVVVYLIKTTVL
ncbi:CorA family Mg2+ transporter protein [Toxoplasma gondii p89]|uniref:CorA family Mg2+ transporter protein n=1 Tax=Toxoplasma gondii p89 TaxID=943119 RepID=A0A086K859_TOXGO|nr:CorA family Mg2+ transporter protein [Toxoplasma gondii p89]